MPRLKPETIVPTAEEDAAITAAAISDADAFPLSDDEWEAIRSELRIGRGHPSVRKVPTTIDFDADVLAALQATGPGWRTRINEIVREYVNRGHCW
jgi:uncharacterized protein (DUF4415 family)